MTCHRLVGGVDGFICTPDKFVNLAPYGASVWCEYHTYLGPAFFRSASSIKEILVPGRKTWAAFEAWRREVEGIA